MGLELIKNVIDGEEVIQTVYMDVTNQKNRELEIEKSF